MIGTGSLTAPRVTQRPAAEHLRMSRAAELSLEARRAIQARVDEAIHQLVARSSVLPGEEYVRLHSAV